MNSSYINKSHSIFEILGFKFDETTENRLFQLRVQEKFTDYALFFNDRFGIFDYAIFRIFGGKKDISGDSSMNIIFKSVYNDVTIDKIRIAIDYLFNEYGSDTRGEGKLSESEAISMKSFWFGRSWIFDLNGNKHSIFQQNGYQIDFHQNSNNEFQISILGANRLLKTNIIS